MATDTPSGGGFTVRCPICGTAVRWRDNPYRPFCSERCQVIDRAAWAEERYAVPSEDSPSADETGGSRDAGGTGDKGNGDA